MNPAPKIEADKERSELDRIIVLLTKDAKYPTKSGFIDYRVLEEAKTALLAWRDKAIVAELENLQSYFDVGEIQPVIAAYVKDCLSKLKAIMEIKEL